MVHIIMYMTQHEYFDPAQRWTTLTKVLLQDVDRKDLKKLVDTAADEIKHVAKDGKIVKEDMTSVDRKLGETERQLRENIRDADGDTE